mgnify:CR=1 FL=1
MPSDLHYLSLDEVARRLKARKLSSVELTESMLDRIGELMDGVRHVSNTIAHNLRTPLTRISVAASLLGDSADTPFTVQRGDANQFIVGLGMAYTF